MLDYECNICNERKDFDNETIWITSSYGVCEECYNKLSDDEIEFIRNEFE